MIVTLLTDFGDQDGFVGALRGVLLSRAPQTTLADIAHHVPRGDVAKAARVLARAAPCFPPGTVHLVVVDPGVGSARRSLVARRDGHLFVAPDNGVLGDFVVGAELRVIAPGPHLPRARGVTFQGRDLFAPVAGALAAGWSFDAVGPPLVDPVRLLQATPPTADARGCARGRVVEVDVFGNLITDVPAIAGLPRCRVRLGDVVLEGPEACYAAVAPGELVLVVGSAGTLEIAVRGGSAAARLGLGAGASVACARVDGAPSSPP